jgi:hypothetical protein
MGLRVLWLPSVTCVGHVLPLPGWGRRSWETAEHKGETQAGRQAGRLQAACQGAWALTPGLLKVEGAVFGPGLLHADMMPLCLSM